MEATEVFQYINLLKNRKGNRQVSTDIFSYFSAQIILSILQRVFPNQEKANHLCKFTFSRLSIIITAPRNQE